MAHPLRQLAPSDYPAGLREIPEVPPLLYMRGALPKEGSKLLAVVGSRALSPYGRDACKSLIKGLAGYPISVVSGLALGADGVAHEAALDAGLHTIAVLASGVADEAVSPRANAPLALRILAQGGALLSENPPTYSPFPSDFPKRNRIVAGLSHAVLVIEAGERSGTLITARLAGEYNRDLMCVPYRIGDEGGYAANLFVRLGAAVVYEPAHILEVLGLNTGASSENYELSQSEKKLLIALSTPGRKDEVIARSGLAEFEALEALVLLELKGRIQEAYGEWRLIEKSGS